MLHDRLDDDKKFDEEIIRRFKRWKAAQPKPEESDED